MTRPADPPPLDARERLALILVAHGLVWDDAAPLMGFSKSTLKAVLGRAYAKLSAVNAPDAVRRAYVAKILPPCGRGCPGCDELKDIERAKGGTQR